MAQTTTVIIGAGHCGLAMSRCLAGRSVDHVVLERGQVANSWRTQRWDSLRLLTPSWMTRLPGHAYRGADPDGYLSAGQGIRPGPQTVVNSGSGLGRRNDLRPPTLPSPRRHRAATAELLQVTSLITADTFMR